MGTTTSILLAGLLLGAVSLVMKYQGIRSTQRLAMLRRRHEIRKSILVAMHAAARNLGRQYLIMARDESKRRSIVEVRSLVDLSLRPYVLRYVIDLDDIERPVRLKFSDPNRVSSSIGQTDDISLRVLISEGADYLKLHAIRKRPIKPAG